MYIVHQAYSTEYSGKYKDNVAPLPLPWNNFESAPVIGKVEIL